MVVKFLFLIYDSNFIVCTDRARIYLSVMLRRKENVVLKMLLYERTKAELDINGLNNGLFYATNSHLQ